MPDLVIRPLDGPTELDLFCGLPYVLNDELERDLAEGRRRPDGARVRAGWLPHF